MTTEPLDPHPPGAWRAPEPGDHRSPCPALNSLANGGDLPRSGRVTVAELVRAMRERVGLTRIIGRPLAMYAMARLGKPGPGGVPVLDLADLSLHGFIEHDASLTRLDAREGDATKLFLPLLEELLALSRDGRTLTLADLAVAHQVRLARSSAGGHRVPFKAALLGALEAALLYLVLARDGAIALADARELLQDERIPGHLAPRRIGVGALVLATVRLAVMGNVPIFDAARRARAIERGP